LLEVEKGVYLKNYRLLLLGAFLLSLLGCSNVGPGFANHPIACSLGYVWDDCLPGTKGWDNGGGKIYRDGAQKVLDRHTQEDIKANQGGIIK
jgi:hypothetical protein